MSAADDNRLEEAIELGLGCIAEAIEGSSSFLQTEQAGAAIALALTEIARALKSIAQSIDKHTDGQTRIAHELKYLGNGDATSRGWGAIEGHSKQVADTGDAIAMGLSDVAAAIREHAERAT